MNLTETEQNLVKDILKTIGRDEGLEKSFADAVGMELLDFGSACDEIFKKLENGRVTFTES